MRFNGEQTRASVPSPPCGANYPWPNSGAPGRSTAPWGPKILTGNWPSVRGRLFAVLAERTVVRPLPSVLRLDFQSSGALVIVVVDVPLRRRLRKNRVVRIYSGH